MGGLSVYNFVRINISSDKHLYCERGHVISQFFFPYSNYESSRICTDGVLWLATSIIYGFLQNIFPDLVFYKPFADLVDFGFSCCDFLVFTCYERLNCVVFIST